MKTIRNIIIVLYAIVALFVTICLLSYNEYKVTTFGTTSLVIIDSDKLKPDFNKGELAIVEKGKTIEVGDKIFFYNLFDKTMAVTLAKVTDKLEEQGAETSYTLEGNNNKISDQYVIGNSKDVKVIPTVGTILSILESKWGFLILIVLPALLAFLYEIFEVFSEMKGNKRKNNGNRQKE